MMTWKPIDLEGIISLDKPLYVELDQFLYEKEGMLGECIVQSIHAVGETPQLASKAVLRLKLSEALENFEKRIRQVTLSQHNLPTLKDFKMTISLINSCLWKYVETLESCVIELFQQLDQIGLEKWHKEMLSAVNSIKILLMHRMEDVSWAIRRMETLLWQYREICTGDKKLLTNLKYWLPWSHLLDRNLLSNLEKSKKFLRFNHKKFADRMVDYNSFSAQIEQGVNKLQSYHAYNSLDTNDRENFKRIYELLKLWELNQTTQSLPSQDIVKALRQVQSEEKIYQVFNDYYHTLRDILFHQARLFKIGAQDLCKDAAGKTLALDIIAGYRAEIRTLGATCLKYRDFLLQTDSNPYIRSRWGFAEWIAGPEPAQSKRLLNLSYEIESLDGLYEKLRNSLEKGLSESEERQLSQAFLNIERWLHDSSQPLISRALMHANVERIVNALVDLDELGSFNRNITDFFDQVLSKTLRVDWKYNVAFEIPKFQEVYQIHKGLIGKSEDRQHFNRINKFKHVFQQVEDWAKKKITQRHMDEIELDMIDIKVHLQDFLASVQRMITSLGTDVSKGDMIRKEIAGQLLEYRYLFGQFFHELSKSEQDERSLRNQFLFVYQYFEAIENKLNEG